MPHASDEQNAWIAHVFGIDLRGPPRFSIGPADESRSFPEHALKQGVGLAALIEQHAKEAKAASSVEIAKMRDTLGDVVAIPKRLVAAIDSQIGFLIDGIRDDLVAAVAADRGSQLKQAAETVRARVSRAPQLEALRGAAPVLGAKVDIDAKIQTLLNRCIDDASRAA
jgi:Cu/Ag efflux pump CusA